MKLVYQYMVIFLNFYTTSNHLHPLQVENCDSNSRLVVDEDGKFRIERVKVLQYFCMNPYSASESDVCRRRILTSKVDPRAVGVNSICYGRRPIA